MIVAVPAIPSASVGSMALPAPATCATSWGYFRCKWQLPYLPIRLAYRHGTWWGKEHWNCSEDYHCRYGNSCLVTFTFHYRFCTQYRSRTTDSTTRCSHQWSIFVHFHGTSQPDAQKIVPATMIVSIITAGNPTAATSVSVSRKPYNTIPARRICLVQNLIPGTQVSGKWFLKLLA